MVLKDAGKEPYPNKLDIIPTISWFCISTIARNHLICKYVCHNSVVIPMAALKVLNDGATSARGRWRYQRQRLWKAAALSSAGAFDATNYAPI